MEALPNATPEEVSQFPAHIKELQNWLLAQGKSDNLVQQTSRNLQALFQDDNKSTAAMATQTYFDLVKVSPKNVSRHNQRSAAVKHLMRFWEAREGRAGQPRSAGDQQAGTPADGTAGTPAQSTPAQGSAGTPGAAAATPTPPPTAKAKVKSSAKRKKSKSTKETEQKPKKKKKESDGRAGQPLATLPSAHGFTEAVEQAQALEKTGEAADALCLLGRDPAKRNASINGVYVNRHKQFHGRDSFVKDKDEPDIQRLLFYSATKSAWKVSNKLDDTKSGFAFARVDDKGKALPTEPSNCLTWRVCDGKSEGYNKDKAVRCLPSSSLMKAAAIASAVGEESDGEMGSGSSSCQQGGSSDAEGSRSSSSSSSASDSGSGSGSGAGATTGAAE